MMSSPPKRLYVLHKLPTPYNDDFFRALHADQDVELQVFHLWRGSERRPWKSELGTGYSNYYMQPKCGIDWHTIRYAWNDRNSLFMIGDWAHFSVIALLLARIIRRSPVALWVDTPQEHLKRSWWKRAPRSFFLRWLFNKVDVIFGSGQPAKRVLISMGAPGHKIVDLQFTVDLERSHKGIQSIKLVKRSRHLRRSVGCEKSGLVYGMSGTLDLKKKAQDIGFKALALCCEKSDMPLGLLVAGTGQDLFRLQNLAEKLGIIDKVNFLGWLEPDEMEAFYMSIDILLHPANFDPFPLVIIEAMSWSKPVIGTSTSGSVEEKVEDGINGFVFSPGNFKQLAKFMVQFNNSPKLLKSSSLSARRTVESWPIARLVKIVKKELFRLSESRT